MTNKEQIQKEIEQTLQSLDGVQRAEANPFLFTRIKARMSKQNSLWERVYSFVARPVIALSVLILVLSINFLAVYDDAGTPTNVTTTADTDNEMNNEYDYMASADSFEDQILNNQ
jgi:hypothetical protein